ncbi:MAG: sigma-70 family RNA polymerase sigma factor [Oscillospiraceae bacterium]|nr:sigma-70 family RNA polymerase sigma factor [Oscillospiraceae bacterium]
MSLSFSGSAGSESDGVLISKCKSGDEKALAELIAKYTPMIRSAAGGFSAVTLDSDDIAQEGMLGFINAVYTYDKNKTKASFSTYAYTCVKNRILSAIRSLEAKKRSANGGLINIDDVSDFDADEDSAPEIKLIEREQYAELLNSFYSVLSDFEKKVLSMYLSGYTYNEISYRLNIEKKSADNALQRIKRKLRAVSLKPDNHGAKHG